MSRRDVDDRRGGGAPGVGAVSEKLLGARVRRLREARGMTRPDLAAAMWAVGIRIEASNIARYEVAFYEPKITRG